MAFCVQTNGLRHSSDSHFEQLGLLLWINNVVGTPTAMIRWPGVHDPGWVACDFIGIGPGKLYVINGDFVKPFGTSPLLGTVPML
jgi:hypothetical protein